MLEGFSLESRFLIDYISMKGNSIGGKTNIYGEECPEILCVDVALACYAFNIKMDIRLYSR